MLRLFRQDMLKRGFRPVFNHILSNSYSTTSHVSPIRQSLQTFSRSSFHILHNYSKNLIPSYNQSTIVRTFSSVVNKSYFGVSSKKPQDVYNILNNTITLIQRGNFKSAQQLLYSIVEPGKYGKDIYFLTLYLMYMTGDFSIKPVEEIKRELQVCGLSEEEMAKLADPQQYKSSINYVIENNAFSGFGTGLSFLLGLLAVYLLIVIFSSTNPANIMASTSAFTPETNINVRFSDVIGLGESLEEVQLLVKYLQDPTQFRRMGAKSPTGVLLTGPPGTGKTLLAKAVAGEAAVPFFFAAGSEFDEMYVGMGAKRVRELFKKARENAPCIVFIDELDAVGGRRNSYRGSDSRQTINQLLNEIGGFRGDEGVLIMAATNLKKVLDPALVRAGRFDLEIRTSLPDREAREKILMKKTQSTRLAEDVDIPTLAKRTVGLSGAELESLINVAAMKALSTGYLRIHNAHILEALDRIQMGSRNARSNNKEIERMTLLHECGHAIVSLMTPGAMPVDKITVIPRGDALGYVSSLPEEKDMFSQTKEQLLARIDVAMGGRAAEEVFYGEENVTTGASSDLQQASNIARGIVYEWGMNGNPRVRGDVSGGAVDQLPYYGEKLRKENDDEIERLLQESYKRAKNIIIRNKKKLLKLADAVEEYETISGEDAKRLLAGKKMVDCYNVTALTKSEDDEYDEKIFEARYASQVENTEKNSNNESTEEEDDFVNDMAKRMLQYRQEEEKEIFEILLSEDLKKKKNEK